MSQGHNIIAIIMGLLAASVAITIALQAWLDNREIARQIADDTRQKRLDYIRTIEARHERVRYFGETGESIEYRHPTRSNMRND